MPDKWSIIRERVNSILDNCGQIIEHPLLKGSAEIVVTFDAFGLPHFWLLPCKDESNLYIDEEKRHEEKHHITSDPAIQQKLVEVQPAVEKSEQVGKSELVGKSDHIDNTKTLGGSQTIEEPTHNKKKNSYEHETFDDDETGGEDYEYDEYYEDYTEGYSQSGETVNSHDEDDTGSESESESTSEPEPPKNRSKKSSHEPAKSQNKQSNNKKYKIISDETNSDVDETSEASNKKKSSKPSLNQKKDVKKGDVSQVPHHKDQPKKTGGGDSQKFVPSIQIESSPVASAEPLFIKYSDGVLYKTSDGKYIKFNAAMDKSIADLDKRANDMFVKTFGANFVNDVKYQKMQERYSGAYIA